MVTEVNLDLHLNVRHALCLHLLCLVCFSVVNVKSLCSVWIHGGGVTFVLGHYGSFEARTTVSVCVDVMSASNGGARCSGWRSRKCCKT